jgi:hypothetical protein
MKLCWKPLALSFFLASAISAQGACAQQAPTNPGDLQKQFDALRAQVQAMQKDLDEIKALLAPLRAARPSPPANLALDLGTRPV